MSHEEIYETVTIASKLTGNLDFDSHFSQHIIGNMHLSVIIVKKNDKN